MVFAPVHSSSHAGSAWYGAPTRAGSFAAPVNAEGRRAASASMTASQSARGSARSIIDAAASGSRHPPAASTTMCGTPGSAARNPLSAFEVGAAPKRTTTSGAARAANRGERSSAS